MLEIKDLPKGLEILDPFLKKYGFEFDKYNFDNNSDDHRTLASYKKENKKFIVDYRFSTTHVLYQYGNCMVSHPFYLDHLGFINKKKHNGFLPNQKLKAFYNILHDFEYLIDDFFKGECEKLKEISKLHENVITEVDRQIRLENGIRLDNIRIEKARREFRNKDHIKCLDIYKFVDNKYLLVELDFKIMEFCNRHI
jgi:predicted glutamine amidotransferase